jgi:phage-related minor tail protein
VQNIQLLAVNGSVQNSVVSMIMVYEITQSQKSHLNQTLDSLRKQFSEFVKLFFPVFEYVPVTNT